MWSVKFKRKAFKELQRLGTAEQRRVQRFVDERLLTIDNPRQLGSPLSGNLSGLWRYRVGDVRIIAQIDDGTLVILVVAIGTRGEIYR